jgi:hypothetical protein
VKQRCEFFIHIIKFYKIVINENMKMLARDFISNRRSGAREPDSRETKKDCVLEAEHCGQKKIASTIK